MIEIYLCDSDVHTRLDKILKSKLIGPYEILTTEFGKPYIGGNPLFFSLSHSQNRAIIAVADRAVGIDIEVYTNRLRESVLNRFSTRERAEIACERDFLQHWTVREAYVKLYGLTIAHMWKRIEFFGGKVYVNGQLAPVKVRTYNFDFGVAAVCTEV